MNRKYTRLAGASLFALVGFSLVAITSQVRAENPKATEISLSDNELVINGKKFLFAPSVDQLASLWGQPDRIKNLANDIRIWDTLGVRSYSEPGNISADSITFTMQKQDSDLSARETFTGSIKIPAGAITGQSKAADLLKLGFEQDSTLKKFYRLELLSGSFLAEVDDSSGALVSLSVSFDFGF